MTSRTNLTTSQVGAQTHILIGYSYKLKRGESRVERMASFFFIIPPDGIILGFAEDDVTL